MSECLDWINADIMIVFTQIKIPNNLTLIIYIIRSQASQPASQAATETGEGRRGEEYSNFLCFYKIFLAEIGWKLNLSY